MEPQQNLAQGVVRVGDGRGFIVEAINRARFIVTAAHCLPSFPSPHAASYPEERTYPQILGDLDGERDITAELRFADPVADIAVLEEPDDDADAFSTFVDDRPAFLLGSVEDTKDAGSTPAWLLTLDGRWGPCRVTAYGGPLWIEDARDGVHGGMSGSPVVDAEGRAIGVVATGHGRKGGPGPRLTHHLPAWLVRKLLPPG